MVFNNSSNSTGLVLAKPFGNAEHHHPGPVSTYHLPASRGFADGLKNPWRRVAYSR
jgi:hypothetical protein